MSRLFFVAVACVASVCLCESNSSAQFIGQGYQFGAGLQAGYGGYCGPFFRTLSREQLPYFAQYPPVYYSHIVPRPYGISPFAVPPGIAPAEMAIPVMTPSAVAIKNPFYNGAVKANVPTAEPSKESPRTETKGKTTLNRRIVNPYVAPKLELVERN